MTIPLPAATATESKFKQGGTLTMKKIAIKPGQKSNVKKNALVKGVLASDLLPGIPVIFKAKNKLENHIQAEIYRLNGKPRTHLATKTVLSIYEDDGKYYIETESSIYEIISFHDFERSLRSV